MFVGKLIFNVIVGASINKSTLDNELFPEKSVQKSAEILKTSSIFKIICYNIIRTYVRYEIESLTRRKMRNLKKLYEAEKQQKGKLK